MGGELRSLVHWTAPYRIAAYTLREATSRDGFETIIRKVADVGCVGVEFAGFPGTTPEEAVKLFGELGLVVPSAYVALPVGDAVQEVTDIMHASCTSRPVSQCERKR